MIETSRRKEASLSHLLMEAGAIGLHGLTAHGVQNLASDATLRYNPATHKALQQYFHAGMLGALPIHDIQLLTGVHSIPTPEVGILAKELNYYGKAFEKRLNSSGLSYHNLSDKHHEYLQAVLSGDYLKIKQMHDNAHEDVLDMRDIMMSTTGVHLRPVRDLIRSVDRDADNGKKIAVAYQKTSFSKFLPKVFAKTNTPVGTSLSDVGAIGEIAGNGILALKDPITAGFNAAKRLGFSEAVGKLHPMIAKAQKKFTNWAFTDAIKAIHRSGVGEPSADRTNMRKYLFNPVYADTAIVSSVTGAARQRGENVTNKVFAPKPFNMPAPEPAPIPKTYVGEDVTNKAPLGKTAPTSDDPIVNITNSFSKALDDTFTYDNLKKETINAIKHPRKAMRDYRLLKNKGFDNTQYYKPNT